MAKKSQTILVLIFCFLIAVTASQIQIQAGLNRGDQRIAEIFDSSHFLDSTRILVQFLKARLHVSSVPSPPAPGAQAPTYRDVGNHLMSDGVTIPIFGGLVLWLLAPFSDVTDLQALLYMQSFFNGVCAVLVAFFALRITGGNIRWAFVTGTIWALYPSGIAASQRILTEIMCAMFMLLTVYCCLPIADGKKNKAQHAFLAGLCFGFLMLTKPVLCLSGAPIIAVALLLGMDRKRFMPTFKLAFWSAAGVGILTLCFVIFIKTSINQWSLIPQRAPLYNVICGSNVPLDGLATVPQGPLSPDLAHKKPAGFLITAFSKDPLSMSDLALRKLGRLFELPWNDFRRPVLGINLTTQQAWHRLWLALGLMATPLALAFVVNGLTFKFFSRAKRVDGTAEPDGAGAPSSTPLKAAPVGLDFGSFKKGLNIQPLEPAHAVVARTTTAVMDAEPDTRAPSVELSNQPSETSKATAESSGKTAREADAVLAKLDQQLFVLLSSIIAFASHFIYMLFEGVPRYGFTAMPFLLILAVWLVHKTISEKRSAGLLKALIPVALLIVLANYWPIQILSNLLNSPFLAMISTMAVEGALMIAIACLTASIFRKARLVVPAVSLMCVFCLSIMLLNAYRESKSSEWGLKLKPGEKAEERIFVPFLPSGASSFSPGWALLLIDGTEALRQARITVNGRALTEAPINLYQFYAKKFDIYSYLQMLSSLVEISPERVRQWRAVEVPVSLLKQGEENSIVVSPGDDRGLTIYGDFQRKPDARYSPTFEFLSHSMIYCSNDSIEWRPTMPARNLDGARQSIRYAASGKTDQDLSSFPGKQTGSFRMLLALGGRAVDRLSNPEKTNFSSLDLEPHFFYPALKKGEANEVRCEFVDGRRGRSIENIARMAANDFRSTMLIDMGQLSKAATHVRVRFTALAKAAPLTRNLIAVSARGVEDEANKKRWLQFVDPLTGTANDADDSPYTCLGRLKPEVLTLPDSVAQVSGTGNNGWQPVSIETRFSTRVVRGRLKELSVEIFPIEKGKCNLILKNARLEVKEEILPDLADKRVVFY